MAVAALTLHNKAQEWLIAQGVAAIPEAADLYKRRGAGKGFYTPIDRCHVLAEHPQSQSSSHQQGGMGKED